MISCYQEAAAAYFVAPVILWSTVIFGKAGAALDGAKASKKINSFAGSGQDDTMNTLLDL